MARALCKSIMTRCMRSHRELDPTLDLLLLRFLKRRIGRLLYCWVDAVSGAGG